MLTPEEFADKYLEIIERDYQYLNLTRILDRQEFIDKQYLDSVCPYRSNEHFKEALESSSTVVDVGFGGGFPVLPLANEIRNKKFIGVESRNKKVEAVSDIAAKMEIKNCSFVHGRIEGFFIPRDYFVVSKAVGTVEKVLGFLSCEKGTRVAFYKGPNFFTKEKKELETIGRNWLIISDTKFSLPNGDERVLLIVESKSVLRRTSEKLEILDA